MNAEQLQQQLHHFMGTTAYYRLNRVAVLTDGTKFLAEEGRCFWLMEAIASHLPAVPTNEYFCVALLTKGKEHAAYLEITDDVPPRKYYATQVIEYTDIELDTVKLYCSRAEEFWVIMVPQEY